jgi:hypothetical protein
MVSPCASDSHHDHDCADAQPVIADMAMRNTPPVNAVEKIVFLELKNAPIG